MRGKTMTTLELRGRINEQGELEIELPTGLPRGEVTVRIDVPGESASWEHQSWTEEEIRELMSPKRKTFRELVEWLDANPPTDSWADLRDNEDGADYIHRMRRQSGIVLDEPGEGA
jgi:hypothetical protein